MQVLRIESFQTHPVRHKMLRSDFQYEECAFPGDKDEKTFHLGVLKDGNLASVASFYYEKNPNLPDTHQYRLRGMATLPQYQNMGFSMTLLQTSFPIIEQNMCTLIWCNARVSAMGLYQKAGLIPTGKEFSIPGIGPHYLMYKKLGQDH